MSQIEHLSAADFPAAIAKGTVLVDFFATWCGPCQMQGEILKTMCAENRFPASARCIKINVDEAPAIAAKLGIDVIPTLVVFRDGAELRRATGVREEAALLELLA